jgi:peptidoglycan/xylan/chitin deacetylase (PgdA/CDA1 family)
MELGSELFTRQLDWLQERGRIVDLDTALRHRHDPDADRLYVLSFDDGYCDLYTVAFPILRERDVPFVLYLTTEPVETQVPLTPGASPLSWDQIEEMLGTGLMIIGAHTHTHPDPRGLSDHRIAKELDESNRLIADRTGITPKHFAYPKGIWDERVERHVRARYGTAVLGAGLPITGATDLLRLHRLPVQRSDGYFFFKRKIVGGLRLEETTRRRIKGYEGPPHPGPT